MKVDGGLGISRGSGEMSSEAIAASVREQEQLGYDGVWSAETAHDAFLPLVVAAEHSEHIELGTAIAVAFARNPMNLAYLANDLQLMSKGRFMLGLGSQIKPHIEKRFAMPWSHPAPRMRELILAIRAIWDAWETGGKLDFRGDFYTHTLMTPFFDPGPNPYGRPKILLAAVGEVMTSVAAEVADGMLVHGFTTHRYLREVTVPTIEAGLERAGKKRGDFQISYPAFVVTGRDDEQMTKAAAGVRQQIAFYGSTPAYRGVLDLHGWGEVGAELNRLSKSDDAGRGQAMGTLIDDEMLDAFAVVAPPDQVAAAIKDRFGDLVDRFSFYAPYAAEPGTWDAVIAELKG
jgi:probable F420-dependent oxidoreductase